MLEIFDVVLFQLPEPSPGDLSPGVQSMRDELKVEELLESDASVDEGGVVRFSERGDRLLDIAALSDALMQVGTPGCQTFEVRTCDSLKVLMCDVLCFMLGIANALDVHLLGVLLFRTG